ncbi:MAG: DUF721 domain-containing protein [Magnetospiraceae bacterium]
MPDLRDKRSWKAMPVSELVRGVARRALNRRGFDHAGLVENWSAIVGPHLATQTCPLKIAYVGDARQGGTLYIKVFGGSLALQVQHLAPQILQKVNGYLGYRAVAGLRIVQGDPRTAPKAPVAADPSPVEVPPLTEVQSDELRAVLQRLGGAVSARARSRK